MDIPNMNFRNNEIVQIINNEYYSLNRRTQQVESISVNMLLLRIQIPMHYVFTGYVKKNKNIN